MIRTALLVAAAYLIGSIPTGYLVVRWLRGTDLRTLESGSVGALNTFRATGAAWAGWLVLATDVLKGAVAVMIGGSGAGVWLQGALAAAAVVGHNWPIWLRGRGGKGLATAAGALSLVTPLAVPAWGLLWGLGYVTTGYIVVGTLVATALVTPVVGVVAGWGIGLAMLPSCLLILSRHGEKLRRLAGGKEPRHYWRSHP